MRLRTTRLFILLIVLAALNTMTTAAAAQQPAGGGQAAAPRPPGLTLTSTAWPDGGQIPVKYAQAGSSTSPALSWTNVPPNTTAFVLFFRDPDVARNGTIEDVLHWMVVNIPGATRSLPEGVPTGATLPDGSFQSSLRGPQYMGPGAAAVGPVHHYTLELFALSAKLDLPATATRPQVIEAMAGKIVGKAVYVGLYKAPQ